jgi:SAM-dependent methyltransferase
MDDVKTSKNFVSLHDDYAFFQSHSTEAEQDIISHLSFLLPLVKAGRTINLLDFGCGDGYFLSQLLSRVEIDSNRLCLYLVEPDAGYRQQALSRIQSFSKTPVLAWSYLPSDRKDSFDLVLANHVLYYVNDIVEILEQVLESIKMGGLFIVTMGGSENALGKIIEQSFAMIEEPVPYHLAEELELILVGRGYKFQKHQVNYEVIFHDREENRFTMLHFLLGENIGRMDLEKLPKLFDQYALAGKIVIQTFHYQFVIQKQGNLSI